MILSCLDIVRPHDGVAARPVVHDLRLDAVALLQNREDVLPVRKKAVVSVKNEDAAAAHLRGNLQLGPERIVEGSEKLNVRVSDVCDNGNVGPYDIHEVLDLAASAHAHFHHCRVFPANVKNGLRHADFVVKVGLGLRGRAQSAHRAENKLLGGGFAHAARDADNGAPISKPVRRSDPSVRVKSIAANDHDGPRISLSGIPGPVNCTRRVIVGLKTLANNKPHAKAGRRRREGVAVKVLALEGQKGGAFDIIVSG